MGVQTKEHSRRTFKDIGRHVKRPVAFCVSFMCFFLQTLSRFNATYPGLFDKPDDREGSEEGASGIPDDKFNKRYGWIFSTKQVADLENIKLDDAWELGVVHVLNNLSYLKAKEAHDKELFRKSIGK